MSRKNQRGGLGVEKKVNWQNHNFKLKTIKNNRSLLTAIVIE